MVCRLLAAKDSDWSEHIPPWKPGLNTHSPAIMGTGLAGVIVAFPVCFLLSFGAHYAPLHFLTLGHWRRGMYRGKNHRDLGWRKERKSKLAECWEKPGERSKPVTVTGWGGWERKNQAWRDSGRTLLLRSRLCFNVGKRLPNWWYYHSSSVRYSLQNTPNRHHLSSNMSCWRTQQPSITFHLPSQQESGQESKRSHLS